MKDNDDPWWVIPAPNGLQCVNLVDGETISVGILQVAKDRVKDYLNDFDGGADDLRVFHFPVGRDVGAFKAVDRFISNQFDFGSRVFAAFYGKGMQRDLQRKFEAANSGDSFLRDGCWHAFAPSVLVSRRSVDLLMKGAGAPFFESLPGISAKESNQMPLNELMDHPVLVSSDQSARPQPCFVAVPELPLRRLAGTEYLLTGYLDCEPSGENVIYRVQPDIQSVSR